MSVLRDPLTVAVPFFIAFVVLEAVSFAVFADDDLRGYDGRDTITSVVSGMVALLFNTIARPPWGC